MSLQGQEMPEEWNEMFAIHRLRMTQKLSWTMLGKNHWIRYRWNAGILPMISKVDSYVWKVS